MQTSGKNIVLVVRITATLYHSMYIVSLKVIHYMSISRTVKFFNGTEFETWAGFGPVGSTQKQIWADYEQV